MSSALPRSGRPVRITPCRAHGVLGVLCVLVIAACTVDATGLDARGRQGVSGQGSTPSPEPTNGPGTPGTSSSGLSGGVGEGSASPGAGASPGATATPQGNSGVLRVTISPQSAFLNVPATAGPTAPGLKTSQQFTGRTELVGGGSNQQVTWTSSFSEVAVSTGGLVTVAPGAAVGSFEIRAISKQDETKFATASVIVARDAAFDLDIR